MYIIIKLWFYFGSLKCYSCGIMCVVSKLCVKQNKLYKTLMCYFMVCRINEVANQPTDIVIGYGYKKYREIDVSVK